MLQVILYLLAATSIGLSLPLTNCDDEPHTIQLPSGRYFGHHDEANDVTTYYGIPYAQAERFELPTPIDNVSGLSPETIVNATFHGPACPNFNLPPPYDTGFSSLLGNTPMEPQSEDCLTMDITVPDGDFDDLPVYFFTPGGGFLVGASFVYNMAPLVSRSMSMGQPIIGISLNYRLGPLGFLNTASWLEEAKVNLGMLDQIEALRFVKSNIHRFGGDADKVTISGESAGADSAMQQLLWTDERLFRSAWLMSIPSTDGPFLEPRLHPKDSLVKEYARACGCEDLMNSTEAAIQCLRTTPVNVMINASDAWQGSGSSVGGFVKERAFDAIRNGHYSDVPLVLSVCRDEGTNTAIGFESDNDSTTSLVLYNYAAGRELSSTASDDFLASMFSAYPTDPSLGAPFDGLNTTYGEPSQYKRLSAIAGDAPFTAPWAWYLKTFSRNKHAKGVWGIVFEEPIPGVPEKLGVQHGSDLAFLFPELFGEANDPRKTGYGGLVDMMFDAIIRFVRYGDPNGRDGFCDDGGYGWPEFGETGMVTGLNRESLAFERRPPWRPGFEVIEKYLIGNIEDSGERSLA